MNSLTTSAFDLPDRLSAKADPALIAGDERHFAAIADSLRQTIADLAGRLDAERKAPGGLGQKAMDRDMQIHRLTARLRALRSASRRPDRSAIDCSRLSAIATKCRSSSAISAGSALRARRPGRSNALAVMWFPLSAPI